MSSPSDLVVIEAAGKLRAVYRCFAALGRPVQTVATLGHLYALPKTFDRLGIALVDDELVEVDRLPERPEVIRHIVEAIAKSEGRVLIATDDDMEGHVIARDVANLVAEHRPGARVLRVLPHAMTADSWRAALECATPHAPESANPGRARRILDRIIAVNSATREGSRRPLGRVQCALLGLAGQGAIPDRAVSLMVPAQDGGAPFRGVGVLHGAVPSIDIAPLPTASTILEPLAQLPNGADCLTELNTQLGLSIHDASALLQSMYEDGDISYPRSTGNGLRQSGAQAVSMLARARGVRQFDPSALSGLAESGGPAHEAVHLVLGGMIERLDIGRPLRLYGSVREAAAAVIGRRSIEAGVRTVRDRPVLAALPDWARQLEWSRSARTAALPWRSLPSPNERSLDLDAGLVYAQQRAGLGSASTWSRHATRLAESGWINAECELSLTGRLIADGVRSSLLSAEISRDIERVLDDSSLTVTERVAECLALVCAGDRDAAQALLHSLTEDSTLELPTLSL